MKAKAMLKQILDTYLKRSTITPDQAIIKQMKKLKDQKKKLESTKMNIYRKMIDLMKEKNLYEILISQKILRSLNHR